MSRAFDLHDLKRSVPTSTFLQFVNFFPELYLKKSASFGAVLNHFALELSFTYLHGSSSVIFSAQFCTVLLGFFIFGMPHGYLKEHDFICTLGDISVHSLLHIIVEDAE